MRYHWRRVFIGHLCPGLFVRTCVRNVSRGTVHKSWQTQAALLAWSVLNFFFRSSRSLPLTLFCRLSGEVTKDTLFVRKENKVSGILRELLKQKFSALHASSTVRVCQLMCTAPLETFHKDVLSCFTNNLGQRRPMNTRHPWYLTDSPVGLRLVLLTHVLNH